LRSSPDGSQIACLMKDDSGISQIFTVSPVTGEPKQLTHNALEISSAFTWSPNGRWIAHALAGQVCLTDTRSGETHPLTKLPRESSSQGSDESVALGEIRKEACVFSPDGTRIAFVRSSGSEAATTNQICVIDLQE
jgi:Tol biopolymer transport system component